MRSIPKLLRAIWNGFSDARGVHRERSLPFTWLHETAEHLGYTVGVGEEIKEKIRYGILESRLFTVCKRVLPVKRVFGTRGIQQCVYLGRPVFECESQ